MTWATVLVLAASFTVIAAFAVVAWVKDKFEETRRNE